MAPKSGMESMLRSLGLGEVLDAANELAKSGAVQKVIVFAEQAETINGKLDAICRHLGITTGPGSADGGFDQAGAAGAIRSIGHDGQHNGARASELASADAIAGGSAIVIDAEPIRKPD